MERGFTLLPIYNSLGKILRIVALLKGLYKGPYSTPPAAKVETKNHHKTMIFGVSEAEILRTPIKIEKLSLWNRSRSRFIMNFEFHGFLGGFFLYFLKLDFFIFYLWMII